MIGTCANCQREGVETGYWLDRGCSTCAVRYGLDRLPQWCGLCRTRAQLAYAEEVAAGIPALQAKIRELETRND